MSVLINLGVGTVYALYYFGVLSQNNGKYCLANELDFHPQIYENQYEMMRYLAQPGHYNVTKMFNFVVLFGFISNFLQIIYKIYKMGVENQGKNAHWLHKSIGVGLFGKLIFVMWVTQFYYLVNYRFSHVGKVCSGDYAQIEILDGEALESVKKYQIYYLISEGNFFKYYALSCLFGSIFIILLAGCFGTIMFKTGSFAATVMLSQAFENMEKIPGMFKPKSQEDEHEDNNYWNMHDENDQDQQARYANMSSQERFRYEF